MCTQEDNIDCLRERHDEPQVKNVVTNFENWTWEHRQYSKPGWTDDLTC